MNAPTTHDPATVTTRDGMSWVRRAVTQDGRGLYAPEGVCSCPEFVMATLVELAEHGIKGRDPVADAVAVMGALPVPVGPKSPVGADRAKAPWGRGEDGRPLLPLGAHWTDIPELVDRTVASIRARVDQAQPGHWYVASATETWRAPGTVRTRVDGYPRTVGQCTNMLPADLELVLHAHDDLTWCLDMVAKLRARVAELESVAGDGSTRTADEDPIRYALTPAVEALHASSGAVIESPSRREQSSAKLRGLLARQQAAVEEPHDDPVGLHHDYRTPRDLPEVTAPDAIEYGIATDNEYGQRVLDPSPDLDVSLERLARCQAMWPNSRLVQRTNGGEWAEVTP